MSMSNKALIIQAKILDEQLSISKNETNNLISVVLFFLKPPNDISLDFLDREEVEKSFIEKIINVFLKPADDISLDRKELRKEVEKSFIERTINYDFFTKDFNIKKLQEMI
jgi:hypothetical protein